MQNTSNVLTLALVLTFLVLTFAAMPSSAEQDQPIAAVEHAARDFVLARQPDGSSADVIVRPIDPRLRLARCLVPLETEWAPGSRSVGRVTVRVACASPAWRLHVQADATYETEAWTLVTGAARGAILTRDMLEKITVRLGETGSRRGRLERVIRDPERWLGLQFERAIPGGSLLSESMLTAPTLVRRGEQVALVHAGHALRVETRATALADGARDERIRVRNARSGRILEAVVTARGRVETGH